ncbi:hypothetical protein KSP39_PZI012607 [Platanthera zijinensis]|uniref:Uncharacterized protein n=1 Tax=Platanthera zijinensis TaxID=2320716 RepID=A0AAP0BGG2_9ASPA
MDQPMFSPPQNRTCVFPSIRLKWRRPFPSCLVSTSHSTATARRFCPPSSVTQDTSQHQQRSLA